MKIMRHNSLKIKDLQVVGITGFMNHIVSHTQKSILKNTLETSK